MHRDIFSAAFNIPFLSNQIGAIQLLPNQIKLFISLTNQVEAAARRGWVRSSKNGWNGSTKPWKGRTREREEAEGRICKETRRNEEKERGGGKEKTRFVKANLHLNPLTIIV